MSKDPAKIIGHVYVSGMVISTPIIGYMIWLKNPPKTYGELVVFLLLVMPMLALAWPLILTMMLMIWLHTIPL
jgi:hypothetical protein